MKTVIAYRSTSKIILDFVFALIGIGLSVLFFFVLNTYAKPASKELMWTVIYMIIGSVFAFLSLLFIYIGISDLSVKKEAIIAHEDGLELHLSFNKRVYIGWDDILILNRNHSFSGPLINRFGGEITVETKDNKIYSVRPIGEVAVAFKKLVDECSRRSKGFDISKNVMYF
ncbi:MAG: hypothetical protein K5694_02285 [Bacilli bacterium]|nr:hypothetical protein [Bacilli bacterium]